MKNSKSINFKSVLTKSIMAAGVTLAGLVALNTTSNNKVHAAVTSNDPQYVTVNYSPNYGVTVWDSYKADRHITGEYLQNATTWKVYDVAYDEYGNKWYNIGENENKWVLAIFVNDGSNTTPSATAYNNVVASTTTTASNTPVAPKANVANTTTTATTTTANTNNAAATSQTSGYNYNKNTTNTTNTTSNYNYSVPKTTTSSSYSYSAPKTNYTQSNASSYTSNVSGSEVSAKAWIAGRESGGSYTARNGQYIGKYQLSASYLNGDYSAANQERVADNYVKGRYGSWTAAQSFWQRNGWY